ncbi:MAG: hypothetical protein WDN00_09120 [Limisphaerales bacterium]
MSSWTSWRRRWARSASCCCCGEAGGVGAGWKAAPYSDSTAASIWIGLGALALGAGEVTHPPRFDDADGDGRRLKDTDDGLFITAGGFADDLGVGCACRSLRSWA